MKVTLMKIWMKIWGNNRILKLELQNISLDKQDRNLLILRWIYLKMQLILQFRKIMRKRTRCREKNNQKYK